VTGLEIFTLVHVALSLAAIGSGFVVMFGLLTSKGLDGWTAFFLATTAATSVTGFGFPVDKFLPSHAIGILSLLALAVAIYARYTRRLAGIWRRAYAVAAVIALYFNVFVLIVQAFLKVPALNALAPTQSEAPFAIAQVAVLAVFVVLGVLAALRFRTEAASVAG
jgi:hypothetical protein